MKKKKQRKRKEKFMTKAKKISYRLDNIAENTISKP